MTSTPSLRGPASIGVLAALLPACVGFARVAPSSAPVLHPAEVRFSPQRGYTGNLSLVIKTVPGKVTPTKVVPISWRDFSPSAATSDRTPARFDAKLPATPATSLRRKSN